jgi:hypothetical protein
MTTTKTPILDKTREADEMRPEYKFDYRQARPNRFAGQTRERRVALLDPDAAEGFTTPKK